MVLDYDSVSEFTRDFHSLYERKSILRNISDLKVYEDRFQDLDYYKVGRRVGLPVQIVNNGFHTPTVEKFVDNLVTGERNFILRQLNEQAETSSIRTVPIETLSASAISNWCNELVEPDHLFLPLDEQYFSDLFEMNTLEEGERVVLSDYEIQVHWVPLKQEIDHGFILNSSGTTTIQKWFSEINEPSEFEHDDRFDELSQNRPLALYFGGDTFLDRDQDSPYQEQVDFLYHVVLSEVLLSDDSALRLEPQKELST